jgi:hypothetical protein
MFISTFLWCVFDESWCAFDESWCVFDESWCVFDESWCVFDESWCAFDESWCVFHIKNVDINISVHDTFLGQTSSNYSIRQIQSTKCILNGVHQEQKKQNKTQRYFKFLKQKFQCNWK